MSKVQLKYSLTKPLDDGMLKRISAAHGIYGFQKIQAGAALDSLIVEYDASRLTPLTVESALRRIGLPIQAA